jgi:hypothetical protein
MDAAMVSTYEIENALRARNTRLLRRALRLETDERYDLIKNMPMYQFQVAAQLLIQHGENANKIQRMAERNKVEVNKQTTVCDILVHLFLRIKNVLDEDVVIESWRIKPNNVVGLSTDNSVRAIAVAALGQIPIAIIPPLGELKLALVILGGATGRENEPVTISAIWTATRRPWPFERSVKIRTTIARLNELKGAHHE